jgi:hypothetical protein
LRTKSFVLLFWSLEEAVMKKSYLTNTPIQ